MNRRNFLVREANKGSIAQRQDGQWGRLGTAYWLGRLVATFLFGLAPTDAMTIAAAIVLIAVVSAVAGYLPARGASLVIRIGSEPGIGR